jgi:hypothetical protein
MSNADITDNYNGETGGTDDRSVTQQPPSTIPKREENSNGKRTGRAAMRQWIHPALQSPSVGTQGIASTTRKERK